MLEKRRESAKNVLEVGIYRGGSIKLWYDFFPNAIIHALDILSIEEIWSEIQQKDRIWLYTSVDAYNEDFFKKTFLDKNIRFDFLLDDGPHTLETQKDFIRLYSAADGILIIEDVQSYDWLISLVNETPEYLKPYIMIYDLRSIKGRYDDIVFTIDKSKKPNT